MLYLKSKLKFFSILSVVCLASGLPGIASAATVTVDGIMSAGEYTGGVSHGSKDLLWYNDHNSIYTIAAGNTNPLTYEINEISSNNFSLNLFFEVPTYARRMIWAAGCEYSGGGAVSADCAPLAPGGDNSYLDAYYAGSHHGTYKMDYNEQTGSELFELIGGDFNQKWQAEDSNGLTDHVTWETSRKYLLDNSANCSIGLCTEFNATSSIEVMWDGIASQADAVAKLNGITAMRLHLSDEAVGLPPVPLPAAFWLFGSALLGLIGVSRKAKAKLA